MKTITYRNWAIRQTDTYFIVVKETAMCVSLADAKAYIDWRVDSCLCQTCPDCKRRNFAIVK